MKNKVENIVRQAVEELRTCLHNLYNLRNRVWI